MSIKGLFLVVAKRRNVNLGLISCCSNTATRLAVRKLLTTNLPMLISQNLVALVSKTGRSRLFFLLFAGSRWVPRKVCSFSCYTLDIMLNKAKEFYAYPNPKHFHECRTCQLALRPVYTTAIGWSWILSPNNLISKASISINHIWDFSLIFLIGGLLHHNINRS